MPFFFGRESVVNIVIGQSNPQGRANNLQSFTPSNNQEAFMLSQQDTATPMKDPTCRYGLSYGSYHPLIATHFAAAGLSYAVANLCKGGTFIDEWIKRTGYLYNRIGLAHAAMNGETSFVTLSMYQSDVEAFTPKDVFKAKLSGLVDDIYADIGVKTGITMGVEGRLWDGIGTWTQTSGWTEAQAAHAVLLRQAKQEVIAENPNAFFAGDESVVETTTDYIHLVTDAQVQQAADIIAPYLIAQAKGVGVPRTMAKLRELSDMHSIQGFKERIAAATAIAVAEIALEASTVPNNALRRAWARETALNPNKAYDAMYRMVLSSREALSATDITIENDASDAEIKSVVNSLVNLLAGV